MTRMLSEALAKNDINVNCVCPGGVATPMLREVSVAYSGVTGEKPEAIFDKMLSQQLVRHLQPIEVARVVSFLLSATTRCWSAARPSTPTPAKRHIRPRGAGR